MNVHCGAFPCFALFVGLLLSLLGPVWHCDYLVRLKELCFSLVCNVCCSIFQQVSTVSRVQVKLLTKGEKTFEINKFILVFFPGKHWHIHVTMDVLGFMKFVLVYTGLNS